MQRVASKHNIIIKTISIMVIGLFLVNSLSWAYPQGQNLAVQSIFDENITKTVRRDIGVIKYYLNCLSRANVIGYLIDNPGDVNTLLGHKYSGRELDISLKFPSINDPRYASLVSSEKCDYVLNCTINQIPYYALFTIKDDFTLDKITVFTETEFENERKRIEDSSMHISHARRSDKHEKDIDHEDRIDTPLALSYLTGVRTVSDGRRREVTPERVMELREYVRGMGPSGETTVVKIPIDLESADTAGRQIIDAIENGDSIELDFSNYSDEPEVAQAFSQADESNIMLQSIFFRFYKVLEEVSSVVGMECGQIVYDDRNYLDGSLFEVIKNAFTHGNNLNFVYPLFISFDKDRGGNVNTVRIFDVGEKDTVSDGVKVAAIHAGLFGAGMGVEAVSNFWEYDIKTVQSAGENLGTETELRLRDEMINFSKEHWVAKNAVFSAGTEILSFLTNFGASDELLNEVDTFIGDEKVKFILDEKALLVDVGGRYVKLDARPDVAHASNRAIHIPIKNVNEFSRILVHAFSAKCGNPDAFNVRLEKAFMEWRRERIDGIDIRSKYPDLAETVPTMRFVDLTKVDDRDYTFDGHLGDEDKSAIEGESRDSSYEGGYVSPRILAQLSEHAEDLDVSAERRVEDLAYLVKEFFGEQTAYNLFGKKMMPTIKIVPQHIMEKFDCDQSIVRNGSRILISAEKWTKDFAKYFDPNRGRIPDLFEEPLLKATRNMGEQLESRTMEEKLGRAGKYYRQIFKHHASVQDQKRQEVLKTFIDGLFSNNRDKKYAGHELLFLYLKYGKHPLYGSVIEDALKERLNNDDSLVRKYLVENSGAIPVPLKKKCIELIVEPARDKLETALEAPGIDPLLNVIMHEAMAYYREKIKNTPEGDIGMHVEGKLDLQDWKRRREAHLKSIQLEKYILLSVLNDSFGRSICRYASRKTRRDTFAEYLDTVIAPVLNGLELIPGKEIMEGLNKIKDLDLEEEVFTTRILGELDNLNQILLPYGIHLYLYSEIHQGRFSVWKFKIALFDEGRKLTFEYGGEEFHVVFLEKWLGGRHDVGGFHMLFSNHIAVNPQAVEDEIFRAKERRKTRDTGVALNLDLVSEQDTETMVAEYVRALNDLWEERGELDEEIK